MANKKEEIIIPENYRCIVTKYVLHFDIDQSLLFPEVSEDSRETILLNILIHYAWGKYDDKGRFKLSQNAFTKVPKDPESIPFLDYLSQTYPPSDDPEENQVNQFEFELDKINKNKFKIFSKD